MKNNITKYEFFTNSGNLAPEDTSKFKIRDKETGLKKVLLILVHY